jgi:hypothetical protein
MQFHSELKRKETIKLPGELLPKDIENNVIERAICFEFGYGWFDI